MRIVAFYEKVIKVFNKPYFISETQVFPNLHSDFSVSIKLVLKEYRLTREYAEDVIVLVRSNLSTIMHTYKLSGAEADQREKDDEHYGRLDLSK